MQCNTQSYLELASSNFTNKMSSRNVTTLPPPCLEHVQTLRGGVPHLPTYTLLWPADC